MKPPSHFSFKVDKVQRPIFIGTYRSCIDRISLCRKGTLRKIMNFDQWYICQFRGTLGEPLPDSDGIPDDRVDGLLDGKLIPAAMRDYYRVAGKHWLNTNHNSLRALDSLESIGEYTIFMDENQLVVQWAIRDSESESEEDDPIVYQGQRSDSNCEWHAEKNTFSQFMIEMWRWILTGDVPG